LWNASHEETLARQKAKWTEHSLCRSTVWATPRFYNEEINLVRSRGLERTPHSQCVLETSRGAIFVVGIDSILRALEAAS